MKVLCPVCNIEGLLQQRGNSSRIQHYLGFESGKRLYSYHKLEVNGSNNGSKISEVNKSETNIFNDNRSNIAVNNSEDISLGS